MTAKKKKAAQRFRYSLTVSDAAKSSRSYEGWFFSAVDAIADVIRADSSYSHRGIGTTTTVACTCHEEWSRLRKTSGLRRTA